MEGGAGPDHSKKNKSPELRLMDKILHDCIYLNYGNMVLYSTWVMQTFVHQQY